MSAPDHHFNTMLCRNLSNALISLFRIRLNVVFKRQSGDVPLLEQLRQDVLRGALEAE
jgi:hypothetical protein